MNRPILFHAILTLALTSGFGKADQTIVVRSGQVGGQPGAAGDAADNSNCIGSGVHSVPFSASGFTLTDFNLACAGTPPWIVAPAGGWIASLGADPDARWIHVAKHGPLWTGYPPQSVLHCFTFDVDGEEFCEVTLTFHWAADDQIGDEDGEPNEVGVYINGSPLSQDFRGGGFTFESSATMDVTALAVPGTNQLVVYQRDTDDVISGLIFSATIEVISQAPCDDTIDEIVVVRSGEVNGNPGAIAEVVTNATCLAGPLTAPYQATAFTFGDLSAACNGTAPLVCDASPWNPNLGCDADARWMHATLSSSNKGYPPTSVVYCVPFEVTSNEICYAELDLCWLADDRLGDPDGGPNEVGAYLNGVPLGPTFRGGDFFTESAATAVVTGILVPGNNTLSLYQRDTDGGLAGLCFSATVRVAAKEECPPAPPATVLCAPAPINSIGLPGILRGSGSPFVADNDLSFSASQLPPGVWTLLVVSDRRGGATTPLGIPGSGLCIGAPFGRFLASAGPSDPAGEKSFPIDLTSLPTWSGAVAAVPGDTWLFQALYRDAGKTLVTDAQLVVMR